MRRIQADGRDRSYLIHIPPKHDPGRPAPVVLVFHGAGMNARAKPPRPSADATDDVAFTANDLISDFFRRHPMK
jgi:poly(3-hydroxybutyrate) depolymerase